MAGLNHKLALSAKWKDKVAVSTMGSRKSDNVAGSPQ